MIDKRDDDFLEHNIKGLMMTLMAHWNAQMDDARGQTEFASIRPADMRVFAQLRGRTLKLSAVHREMGFSRQAAQQAIDRLVAHDMLAVEPVVGSKRDKVILITPKGQRWRATAAAQIRLIEAQIAAAISADDTEHLRRSLIHLVAEVKAAKSRA